MHCIENCLFCLPPENLILYLLGLILWETAHNHSPCVFPMHSWFSVCHKPIFHRLKVQALIPCTETTPLLLHHVKFHPLNFSRSAIPKLLIRPIHCVQRDAPQIYSHTLILSILVSCPLLIMPFHLNNVSPGLICPLERGGCLICSLLSFTLPKDLGEGVTINARKEEPSTRSPALHQSQWIQTQFKDRKDLPLTGWLWLILFQELCLHAVQIHI